MVTCALSLLGLSEMVQVRRERKQRVAEESSMLMKQVEQIHWPPVRCQWLRVE